MRKIKPAKMIADKLAEELVKKEEEAYLRIRSELLNTHFGKWVTFYNGKLVSSGDDLVETTFAATQSGVPYTFCTRVGFEDQIKFRVRRIEFSYDKDYKPPIPRAKVVIRGVNNNTKRTIDNIILDTGADLTCLPATICRELSLDQKGFHFFKTVGGSLYLSTLYNGVIKIDSKSYPSLIQPLDSSESLLGRDVLNQMVVTFDGIRGRVTIEE